MGYRSEVVCAFIFQDELERDAFHTTAIHRFCAVVEGWEVRDKEWFIQGFTTEYMNSNYVLLMKFEEIKWYPDYEIPKFVADEMMPECIKRGGAYAFVRIGERSDDIDESSEHHEDFEDFDESEYVRVNSFIEIG